MFSFYCFILTGEAGRLEGREAWELVQHLPQGKTGKVLHCLPLYRYSRRFSPSSLQREILFTIELLSREGVRLLAQAFLQVRYGHFDLNPHPLGLGAITLATLGLDCVPIYCQQVDCRHWGNDELTRNGPVYVIPYITLFSLLNQIFKGLCWHGQPTFTLPKHKNAENPER